MDFIINFKFNFIMNVIVVDNIITIINTCSFVIISSIINIMPYCLATTRNNNIVIIVTIELIR